MRTNIFATACGVLALAGFTGSAQTPQTPPTQPTTSSAAARPASDDKPTVTVTGCLTGDSKASSSASPTGASRAAAKYVLTNVQETGAPASSTPSAGAGKSYVLKSDASVDLSAHVNHKVQITGSLDKSASSATYPSSATASEKAQDSMNAPTLKVSNLTMVSSTCS